MTHYDTLITGGTVVRARHEPFVADVAIRDGKIAAVLAPGSDATADEIIDAAGLHVLPGSVDPHCHIALSTHGMGEYATDTVAAALGGVTTMFYMVSNGGSYLPVLEEHYGAAAQNAAVDFGYHVTLMTEQHLTELDAVKQRFGLTSFKYYMHFRGDEGHYLGVEGTHDGMFYKILQAVKERDDLLLVHAENPEVIWVLRDEAQAAHHDDLAAWDEARPAFVEAEAVRRATYLAARVGTDLYLVHVSTADSLEQIRHARNEFPELNLSIESCPHYLTHTVDYERGVVGKVNPPLRTAEHVDALWDAVADGTVNTIGSDHVGRGLVAKQGTIWEASAGFPNAPVSLPVLLSEGHLKRGVPLQRVVELTAKRPSELLKVDDRKGDIAEGLDADLALVDLSWERTPEPEWLGTFSDYSLYENFPLTGWPKHTLVRGNVVVRDGVPTGISPVGAYVRDAEVNA